MIESETCWRCGRGARSWSHAAAEPACNTETETAEAELHVSKELISPSPVPTGGVRPGQVLIYLIRVHNSGGREETTTLTETVPEGTTQLTLGSVPALAAA